MVACFDMLDSCSIKCDSSVRRQVLVAGCIYIGQILVGFGMGWTAPVVVKLEDPLLTPLPEVISAAQAGRVGSMLFIGTIIGPHISGVLSNQVGRKPALMLGGILTLISFILVITTRNLAMVYALRIVNGLGIGIIAVLNLVYIGEIASTSIRGVLLTCTGIFSTLGTLIIYAAGPYVSYAATGYIGGAISLVYLACLCFVPETPVFMLLKGKEIEAQQILQSLGREDEIKELDTKQELENKPTNKQEWLQIFTLKSNRKAFMITLTLSILQQLSGVVAVLFYVTSIFAMANFSRPDLATIVIGVTQLGASCFTPCFVERSGRKSLLMFSTAACAVSLTALGVFFALQNSEHHSTEDIGWVPLAALIFFFLSYDLGFGIIPNTLLGEMFTPNVRSIGSALVSTIAWLAGFGVASVFTVMLTSLGPHTTFWICAGACVVAFLFTLLAVPETKGKSLEEIREMLS